MPMYRVLRKLDIGKGRILHPGTFSRLEWLEQAGLDRLKMRGAISEVRPPPLEALPGWGRRAKKVHEVAGVENAEQFLGVDELALAEQMGVQIETIQRWKTEVQGWLTAPPAEAG